MRPRGTATALERRRRRALRLLENGHSLGTVARMVHAAVSAVWRWRDVVRREGPSGLRARPTTGRPRRLSAHHHRVFGRLLARGASEYGYASDRWTTARVAAVIAHEFSVRYHPAHVSRLLAADGWSCKRPAARARGRLARWRRYRWIRRGGAGRPAGGTRVR